ncbi:MAG: response regulator [Oscillospiraceae bacterium]|nr:response regulator [Oscillospiraceae bacterium]
MIKVLIADDEARVCRLIQSLVDWEALEMEIIGVAHNGMEALELAGSAMPDLIITDIRMPGCTGLEMIGQLRKISCGVTFIIISGYTDFEYTRLAIQYGVSDYLLKPISKAELTTTLTRVREDIETRRQAQAANDRMRRSFCNDQYKVRACYFMDLRSQKSLALPLEQLNREYRLSLRPGRFRGFVIKLDYQLDLAEHETEGVIRRSRDAVLQPLKKLCSDCEIWFEDSIGWGFCNYPESASVAVREQIEQSLQRLRQNREMYPHIQFSIALAEETDEAQRLGDSILAARAISHERLVYGCQKILTRSMPFSVLSLQESMGQFLRQLRAALDRLNAAAVHGASTQLRQTVLKTRDITGQEMFKLVTMVGANALEEWEQPASYEQARSDYLRRCAVCSTPEQLFACLEQLSLGLLESAMRRNAVSEAGPLRLAKRFMENHYMENLTLEQVASIAGFNSNYFSSQFKREFGMGFSDQLTLIRLNKAKELLRETDVPISEVCYRVGYQDIRSFNRAFKKATELRPSEFKKLYAVGGAAE